MRYYLDFEGTCFDSSAFSAYMAGKTEDDLIPGELSQFLYPDAAQFLRDKENAVTIITTGSRATHEAKTKSALHGIPRMSVMYTDGVAKGQYLAPHTHLHVDAVLADDSVEQLQVLAKECPQLGLYEVRRGNGEGDGSWPVIRSLAELP